MTEAELEPWPSDNELKSVFIRFRLLTITAHEMTFKNGLNNGAEEENII